MLLTNHIHRLLKRLGILDDVLVIKSLRILGKNVVKKLKHLLS